MKARRAGYLLAALALVLAGVPTAPASEPAPLGPAHRSADGRFTNPGGDLSHGSFGVRFPFFLRRIAGAYRDRPGAPERLPNDGAWLRENARHSLPTVTWVGHATLLVQMDHVTFLTDPIWSDRPSPVSFAGPHRFVPPGLALEDLPPIDFVVVSHSHYDHLDLRTLRDLAERDAETLFLVPLGNRELLRSEGIANVEELDWGGTRDVEGVTVHCLPAQHWSQRGMTDKNRTLWASWAVTGPERRFYFAGDTGYFDGFARIAAALGPFDLAAVPIGAYLPVAMMQESHLNPEEALQAALDLEARRALAMHFGTFDLSDEPLDEPPRRFREAGAASRLGEADTWVLEIGETRGF
ncbi:MAG: MBL fold metallo-hydrolase [Myxococcota bacterium]|nr:MBL fold metallo-hydrolase [Myxococcota bacterium]